ncbi:TPR repeat [Candidatus Burkholderia verschuerenii]|uniref:TPR repeat n=1 Tax=Candidatus Burkholderia verschuerenii TaxID=242163 RepID=A0A0L0MFL7_9BURK|nr:DUF2753 family protein [Candidatus Burkholderia verschuerenii]KND61113.1 TPR repeat [Candidatus Burkholderia verschuerenii]
MYRPTLITDPHESLRTRTQQPTLPQWESEMRQATQAERDGHVAIARAGYEHALSIARQLLDAPPSGRADDCLAALVVSHHNLADLLVDAGEFDAAALHLCLAHETLIALHLHPGKSASLRRAALHHSRETHVALIRHLARHGPHPRIARTLEHAHAALDAAVPARQSLS